MRFTLSINQVQSLEWGITMQQAALLDLINQASSWADPVQIDGKYYYWLSRNKIISELPLAYKQPDTAYRGLLTLKRKKLINYTKDGKRDLVSLTEKGRKWNVAGTPIGDQKLENKSEENQNSENNPSKFGNKSELNSENNPTNKNTNIHKSINDKREKNAPEKLTPSDTQIELAQKYGLLSEMDMMISSFLANGKAKGLEYDCWSSAFTLWLNREIKITKAQQSSFESEQSPVTGYHPSHATDDKPMIDTRPSSPVTDNWTWKEPLPGMSIPATYKYLDAHRMAGESNKKAYDRLYNELVEQGL